MTHARERGFTLMEVLIALAIVALSAGALLGSVTSSASNVIYLKEKTLAEWVALNRLTEIRIDRNMPQLGRRKGNSVMGGLRWEWEEEVTELPIEGMFRIEVRAHSTGEAVDDSRPEDRPGTQTSAKTTSSGSEMDRVDWTSTAIGVMGSSRSDMRAPIAAPLSGDTQRNPQQPPPGGAPNPPRPGAPTT
jgi:general secretion pathway protein I